MIEKLNYYGKNKIPILFIIDFDMINPVVIPLNEIDQNEIKFNVRGNKNYNKQKYITDKIEIKKYPISFESYNKAFIKIQKELRAGNSYLLNLTFPTPVKINLSLEEIFHLSNAKYKLFYKNQFTVFSPEQFVIINENSIFSYPMKGTIDASIQNAGKIILDDEKEFAEHITIVDLIRNDLGMIAKEVKVNKFRYIDNIKAHDKNLLQISSEIQGELENNWQERLGEIIFTMLPAGSVTGAPKKKTIEIIKDAEGYKRGYYTGIFGIFDGENLDSAVMIRFIENTKEGLIYKSGGGITIYSDAEKEYQELLDKIYVPIA